MPGFSILPVRYSKIVAAAEAIVWPITGVSGSAVGMVDYCITECDRIPVSIQFNLGESIYGPYYFIDQGNGEHLAIGMMEELDISGVVLIIGEWVTIEIVSIYS